MRTVKQTGLIIKYTNLLHAFGVGSEQAADFKNKHSEDAAFLSRAGKLDSLFALVSVASKLSDNEERDKD